MKIIILSITPYKEKDAIITAIKEDGLISISVRSLFSEKSKNKALNVPLTIADVTLEEGKYKYPFLKEYSIIASPLIYDTSLEYMTALNVIIEVTNKLLTDEDKHLMFNILEEAISALKSSKNYYLVILSYINNIFKISGYDFEVDRCVNCGSNKHIVAFSFNEGGFICKDCFNQNMQKDLNVTQMKLMRKIYINDDFEKLNDIVCDKNDALYLLNKYYAYIYDNFGINLASFKTL